MWLQLAVGLTAAIYLIGLRRLREEAGPWRGVAPWRTGCFGAGLLLLAVALFSPLDSWSESLFAAHMVQHLLLTLAVPPLLVLGAPSRVMLWAFPPPGRRALGRWWLRRRLLRGVVGMAFEPAVAWALSVGALLVWHLPRLYEAALGHEAVHAIEHVCFLGTGLLFWWVILRPDGYRRLNYAVSVLYLFTAALPGGLLGALLTFAGHPLYHSQSAGARLWGLTPLQDQQLAGLIMWMPGGLVYFGAAAGFFLLWLGRQNGRRFPSMAGTQ